MFYSKQFPTASFIELITFGIINALIILFSVFFHELAHSLISHRNGLQITEFELSFFGGSFDMDDDPKMLKSQVRIYAAGPLSNLILGIILILILTFPHINFTNYFFMTIFFSGFSNIVLAVFNLIPTLPLDGARILRAYIWSELKDFYQSTKIVMIIGVFFGSVFLIYGFYLFSISKFSDAFWLLLIGIFLCLSSWQSYRYAISTYMQELKEKFKQTEEITFENSQK